VNSITGVAWAMEAEGLTPGAKLVLILIAGACDQDGRVFDIDKVQHRANVEEAMLGQLIDELRVAGFATPSVGTHPVTGERKACLLILSDEVSA
jgi:hypothetical protein